MEHVHAKGKRIARNGNDTKRIVVALKPISNAGCPRAVYITKDVVSEVHRRGFELILVSHTHVLHSDAHFTGSHSFCESEYDRKAFGICRVRADDDQVRCTPQILFCKLTQPA